MLAKNWWWGAWRGILVIFVGGMAGITLPWALGLPPGSNIAILLIGTIAIPTSLWGFWIALRSLDRGRPALATAKDIVRAGAVSILIVLIFGALILFLMRDV